MMPAVRPSACGLYIDDLPFSHFLVTEEFDRSETWKGESSHVPALCVFSLRESSFLSCLVTTSWVMSYDDHDAGRASEHLWSVHRRPAFFSFSGHRRVRSIKNLEGEE